MPAPGLAITDWSETEGRRPVDDCQAPTQGCTVTRDCPKNVRWRT